MVSVRALCRKLAHAKVVYDVQVACSEGVLVVGSIIKDAAGQIASQVVLWLFMVKLLLAWALLLLCRLHTGWDNKELVLFILIARVSIISG